MTGIENPHRDETRFAYPDNELRDLVPEFLSNRKKEMPQLESFVADKDFESLRRMGHTLKGICASFGFPYLGRLGRKMEEAAEARDQAAAGSVVEQMKHYINTVQVVYEGPA